MHAHIHTRLLCTDRSKMERQDMYSFGERKNALYGTVDNGGTGQIWFEEKRRMQASPPAFMQLPGLDLGRGSSRIRSGHIRSQCMQMRLHGTTSSEVMQPLDQPSLSHDTRSRAPVSGIHEHWSGSCRLRSSACFTDLSAGRFLQLPQCVPALASSLEDAPL